MAGEMLADSRRIALDRDDALERTAGPHEATSKSRASPRCCAKTFREQPKAKRKLLHPPPCHYLPLIAI
jgi:hypothetical protein